MEFAADLAAPLHIRCGGGGIDSSTQRVRGRCTRGKTRERKWEAAVQRGGSQVDAAAGGGRGGSSLAGGGVGAGSTE
jgi:hypothetical protein